MKIKKFNWKVLVALLILAGAVIWSVDSIRARGYGGSDLNVGVGNGLVTVTNPSDEAIPVQLVGERAGTFTVSSSIEGVSGRSVTQGNGRNATQLLEFALPPGASQFTVVRGADIHFVTIADTPLEVAVQPLNAEDTRNTLLIAGIVILGSLFYLSSLNGHRWISPSRRKKALDQAAMKENEQQNFKRMFGNVTSEKP
ncbi:MAG: hypothetical protein K8L99_26880 [Anaerolineae bacterium]|nr:hypothetical protein [Anaerolineae bacterium]